MATLGDYASGKMHDVIILEKRSEPYGDLEIKIYWTMPKYGFGSVYSDEEAVAVRKYYENKSYQVEIDKPDFTGARKVKVIPDGGIDSRLDKKYWDYDD